MATAYNPKLVTSGLVMYLDAGNPASYPGSGTAWSDLSGNSRNVSLVNGPTFSSDALGSVVFDGVNDYGTASGISTAGSMAISCWFKTSTQQTNKYLVCFSNNISLGNNGFDVSLQGTQVGSYARASATTATSLFTTNYYDGRWHNLCATHDGTTHRVYYDGVQVASSALSGGLSIEATNTVGIGCFPGPAGYANCSISQVAVYNRALSAGEISSNFTALRGRYGV
jgi:hypothetical protein